MRTRSRKSAVGPEGPSKPAKLEMGRLESAIGFLLLRAWRDAERRFDRHFRDLRLTPPQFATLILLELNHEATPGELSAALGMGHNNFVLIVDNLVERGLITRTTCADDRRKRRLALTESGADLLQRAHAAENASEVEFKKQFGAGNPEKLLALLRRIEEP